MRGTNITPEVANYSHVLQYKLDKMWNLIEDKYEEDWRLDENGDMILEVDSDMLERILSDNIAAAWYDFGAHAGGQRELNGPNHFLSRPEKLKGTYIIKGVYHGAEFVNWARTYFFVQEGA